MAKVSLAVNGRKYSGWKEARVTRGITTIAGGFELSVAYQWAGQESPWPIAEEDECTLSLDGMPVIIGYVDRLTRGYSATDHAVQVSGRDKTGMLVDCSAVLDQWEFHNCSLLALAKKIAAPFDINVTLQNGLKLPAPAATISVNPGDTAFDVIERACRLSGVLPVSDGVGGLLLTRAGTARAFSDLRDGKGGNILAAEIELDATQRYRRYVVAGQQPGTDTLSGDDAAEVSGDAFDANVRRKPRILMVRPEGNTTIEHAQSRARWEATVRAGRATAVSVTVQGWQQGDGSLWPVNALVRLDSRVLGIAAQMLITEATYSLSENAGATTRMTLMRPDAFTPEPEVPPDSWKIADTEKRPLK